MPLRALTSEINVHTVNTHTYADKFLYSHTHTLPTLFRLSFGLEELELSRVEAAVHLCKLTWVTNRRRKGKGYLEVSDQAK